MKGLTKLQPRELRSVSLRLPSPFLSGVAALWDVPGFDNPDGDGQTHTEQAEETLYKADAIILVVPETGLHESNIALLQDLSKRRCGLPIAIVINKTDRISPEEAKTIIAETRQRLRQLLPEVAPAISVFGVSSWHELYPLDTPDETFTQLEHLKTWIQSGALLDTQAVCITLLRMAITLRTGVLAWQIGDYERSWSGGSPEVTRLEAFFKKQFLSGLSAFATEQVLGTLRSPLVKDLSSLQSLSRLGIPCPETIARAQMIEQTTKTTLLAERIASLWRSHDRDNRLKNEPIRPALTALLLQAGFKMPSAGQSWEDWLFGTGLQLDSIAQVGQLQNYWQTRSDEQRLQNLRTLQDRLQATLR